MRTSFFGTTAMVALVLTTPAFAQEAPSTPSGNGGPDKSAAQEASPTPSDTTGSGKTVAQQAQSTPSETPGLGEIVVTAQRKEETLQKAAIAIDAISGADLTDRGISDAIDITKAVPAISFPATGGNIASIFLRGVGNITTSDYVDPAVVPSYDGVVLAP